MKNAVLLALLGGFVAGGISGYTVHIFVAPNSAQEELAKLQLQDRKDAEENWKKTKDSVHRMLGGK
jgi:gas vesicle protein